MDKIAPVITRFRATNKVFALGSKPTALSAAVKKGSVVRYALSEDAKVRITIQQVVRGKLNARRYVKRGSLSRRSVKGANSAKFSGRLGRKALRPGTYRATAVATDAAGNPSKLVRLTFRIVRG